MHGLQLSNSSLDSFLDKSKKESIPLTNPGRNPFLIIQYNPILVQGGIHSFFEKSKEASILP